CPALSLARLEIRNFVTSLLRRARPDDLAISSSRDATAPTLSLGVGARLCRLLTGVLPRFCLLTPVCAASYEGPARDVRLAPAPGPKVALPTSAAWQLELADLRLPAGRRRGLARGGVVLVHVPQGAVVDRVDVQR